jgi:N-carbamoylputrescine amidase
VAVIGPDGGLIEGEMPDGTRVHRFAKVHLAQTPRTGVDETFFFQGGPGFPLFSTPKAKVGVLVCYDRRFPEGWRALALQGAEVVFMVADVPAWAPSSEATAEEMFLIELRTRALENLFFVVAANKVGVEAVGDKKTRFFGRSCVLGPTGAVLAEASSSEPALLQVSIDLEEVKRARTTLPYFTGRKPEAYEILTRPLS